MAKPIVIDHWRVISRVPGTFPSWAAVNQIRYQTCLEAIQDCEKSFSKSGVLYLMACDPASQPLRKPKPIWRLR